ncbi:glycosyltransferase [Prochlorococcus marinus]|uniref:glycosyltransferase n=1 Tax=Prochlorococcus marinus TaxID=1219 RepID=UPI0022B43184|nr:glycosyltransferase [Prochlorococcus marinus]
MQDFPNKIALIHEWFNTRSSGGSEQVVHAFDGLISSLGSTADLFALVDGDSHIADSWLFNRNIKTSFIQKIPFGKNHVQKYLPLLPYAIEQFDLRDYPLIISSSHLVAKGVLTSPDQLHLSYVHTPVRYAWDQMDVYLERSFLRKIGLGPFVRWQLHHLRQWDQLSAGRVDCLLANSRFTARRISKYWGRNSEVLHPPVEVERFNWNNSRDDYYLCLCRLVPNKKVDLVIQAFNILRLPLLVVGDGPEKNYLRSLAGPTIQIMGYQSKENVEDMMQKCRAYVYAGIEDFGIAPVEAMAAGAPVIALGIGGLLDTVRCVTQNLEFSTGILFKSQKVKSLVDAVSWFEEQKLWKRMDPELINKWAQNFSLECFNKRFQNLLEKAWSEKIRESEFASTDPVAFKKFDS